MVSTASHRCAARVGKGRRGAVYIMHPLPSPFPIFFKEKAHLVEPSVGRRVPRRERRDARLVPEVGREPVPVTANVQWVPRAHFVALRVRAEHAVAHRDVRNISTV